MSKTVLRSDEFAQDGTALTLARDGLANGDHAALAAPWFRIAFTQPLGHAEGPDHLDRIDRLITLRDAIATEAPPQVQPIYRSLATQAHKVRDIIARFGRHLHRNAIPGRASTTGELTYIETRALPHLCAFRG